MRDSKVLIRLRELQEEVAREKDLSPDTLRRLLAKVDEYSQSHRASGLPDDLLKILADDLARPTTEQERGLQSASPPPNPDASDTIKSSA